MIIPKDLIRKAAEEHRPEPPWWYFDPQISQDSYLIGFEYGFEEAYNGEYNNPPKINIGGGYYFGSLASILPGITGFAEYKAGYIPGYIHGHRYWLSTVNIYLNEGESKESKINIENGFTKLAKRLSKEKLSYYGNTKFFDEKRKYGYLVGFEFGFIDAYDAKIPNPKDIKIYDKDKHKFNNIFVRYKGGYKGGYKFGYEDGYKEYLKFISDFFKEEEKR